MASMHQGACRKLCRWLVKGSFVGRDPRFQAIAETPQPFLFHAYFSSALQVTPK
jgi:hypothetical protein